ncbi:unnamed protein product, partial [Citrullus colocynthis]
HGCWVCRPASREKAEAPLRGESRREKAIGFTLNSVHRTTTPRDLSFTCPLAFLLPQTGGIEFFSVISLTEEHDLFILLTTEVKHILPLISDWQLRN